MTFTWSLIFLSSAWLGFAYAGYPLILWLLARRSPQSVRSGDAFPPISVIIAVHNGERDLARKLDATLDLAYPGSVEVIVASDASTDGTDAIAESNRHAKEHSASLGPTLLLDLAQSISRGAFGAMMGLMSRSPLASNS